MKLRNALKFGFLFGALWLASGTGETTAGMVSYDVMIQTSGFSGNGGYLDIQLGTAGDGVPIQALIDGFTTDATVNQPTDDLSNGTAFISGSLPGQLTLFNDDSSGQSAYASQYVASFGTAMSFLVTLSGDAIGAPSVSMPSLSISLFGAINPYFSGPIDQNNAAVFFQVNTDGTVTTTTYAGVSPYNDPAPSVQAVPEPGTLTLLAVGLSVGSLAAVRRRKTAGR